jgi:Major Facilitator Superfamily
MKRLFWLLAATAPVAVVTGLSWFGVFTFVNAYLVDGLGWSNAAWTKATLWITGGMLFWYPLCTELSARIGRLRTVTMGLAAAAVSYALLSFAAAPWAIHALLFCMGWSTSAHLVSWMPFAAEVGRERPGLALGLSALVINAAAMALLVFGGRLIATGDYRLTFRLLSGACAVSTVAFFVLGGHLERIVHAESCPGDTDAPRNNGAGIFSLTWRDIRELLTGPVAPVILLGICAAPFAFQASNMLFPNLSRDVHGLGEGAIADLVAYGRGACLVTLLVIPLIIDRLNVIRCYGVGLALDGFGIALIALAPTPMAAGGAYLLFYLFHGTVWAAALPAVSTCVRPRLRDSAFALALMAEIAAIFSQGLLASVLLGRDFALSTVFLVCGTVTAVGGTALVLYSLTTHATRRPEVDRLDVLR